MSGSLQTSVQQPTHLAVWLAAFPSSSFVEGYFKINLLVISLHCCLIGLEDKEKGGFAKTLTISFLVLSDIHVFIIDCITSGLQFSGIISDDTVAEKLQTPPGVGELVIIRLVIVILTTLG